MSHYLLLCKSLTYAQRASRVLERRAITATITKAVLSMNVQGCSYCVKISARKLDESLKILREAGLEPVKIYLESGKGFVKEVGV